MPDKLLVDATPEREVRVASGWPLLLLNLVVLVFAVYVGNTRAGNDGTVLVSGVLFATAFLMLFGYFTLQPKQARVLILFGDYKGTVRRSGFHWANPFYA